MHVVSDETDAAWTEEDPSLLGYERTRIASERTLMAWVRTALSLIGFGFSIPKFFGYLAATEGDPPGVSPRVLGIALIGMGILGLIGGILQHVQLMNRIAPPERGRDVSIALITAVALWAVGLIAFVNVLFS